MRHQAPQMLRALARLIINRPEGRRAVENQRRSCSGSGTYSITLEQTIAAYGTFVGSQGHAGQTRNSTSSASRDCWFAVAIMTGEGSSPSTLNPLRANIKDMRPGPHP